MDQSPAAAELYGVPQMEHFMVDKILNGIERYERGIENAADDDGVMRRIIVAQASQSLISAPGHLRSGHQAMEETQIQLVKNAIKVIVLALWTFNALTSAQLPDQVGLLCHVMTAGIFAVSCGMGSLNGLAIQLGDEDMQDSIKHRFRRTFKKVRETDEDASLAQADGAIDVGEAIKTDFKFRQRSTGTQVAIRLLKNLGKSGSHLQQKLAANARK